MADVAFVELSGATLGLYAGMEAQELQHLVRAALHLDGEVCCGFQMAPIGSKGRNNRNSSAIPRIVPLSLACKAPELLVGHVSALMASTDVSGSSLEPKYGSKDDARLENLLQALETELSLSSFESAVLRSVCEQQKTQVLKEMGGKTSVDQKKNFLLQLLRPTVDVHPRKEDNKVDTRPLKEDTQEMHAELVAKQVAAIGHKVFSPQVQLQLLTLAESTRQKWKTKSSFSEVTQLLSMVERLLDKHVLPEEHGAHLVELVLGGNRVLLSALQSECNVADLETTAKRLAALGCDPPKPITTKRSRKSPKKVQRKRVRNAATPSAESVVRSLHAQHMLTSLELDIVQALVAQDDSQVLKILRDFEQSDHRDVSVLRDALVAIVEEITMELGDEEKAAAAFARGMDDAVREENQSEHSDDEAFAWQRHLTFLLAQWQTQHLLTPKEVITLRKMVAKQHNLLESAYEVFAADGDARELLDTLQRVAKLQRQIEQSQTGEKVQINTPASGLSLQDVVRQMQQRGVVQAGDAGGLLVLFHGGNEALQAANEAFQADGDVHELEETLLLVVKHARFGVDEEPLDERQVVSRLLAEYGRSGRLELWQIQLLMSLLKACDPRLLAAFDVFNEDKNAEELVDTLEILVELAAWERHRRTMIHDWIAPLARSGKLPLGGAERLVQLVKARDDRVVAALVVYLSDGNKEEFVDTLARIARLEAIKLKDVQADVKQNESEDGHLILSLLEDLEDKCIITGEEREGVEELLCSGDPRMLAAMDVLASTHDAEDFADTTRRILAKVKEVEAPEVSEWEVDTEEATGTVKQKEENTEEGDEKSPAAEETAQNVAQNECDINEQNGEEQDNSEQAASEDVEEMTEAVKNVTEDVMEEEIDGGDEEEKPSVQAQEDEKCQELEH